jgi:hypothetical protein
VDPTSDTQYDRSTLNTVKLPWFGLVQIIKSRAPGKTLNELLGIFLSHLAEHNDT